MLLAEFSPDPQVIIIFIAVVFAAVKSFLERRAELKRQAELNEVEEFDFEQAAADYEEELERQRREIGLPAAPPPLPIPTRQATVTIQRTPTIPLTIPKPKPIRPQVSDAQKAAARNFERISNKKKSDHPTTHTRIQAHLKSPSIAREALVLAEIFGKPKGLQ